MVVIISICQLKGGCMGCCGRDFVSVESVRIAIRENTIEFDKMHPNTKSKLIRFRDRAYFADLRDGVCRNVIEKKGHIFCPLHPALNKGEDLRKGHCDINYQCHTAKIFLSWDEKKQKRFVEFINNLDLDNVTYSLKLEKGNLLQEFMNLDDGFSK